MKPADAKAPKFDSNWWKANKAKAADADAGLEKALKHYEDEKKAFFAGVKTQSRAGSSTEGLQKALGGVKTQAKQKKADPKLGALQKETKEGLANYEKLSDAAIAECKRVAGSPIMTGSVLALIKSAPQFKSYCVSNYQAESYNFLSLMAKNPEKGRRWYDDFIKSGSKFEINIANSTRAGFDKIAAAIAADPVETPDNPATWGKAPWDQAVSDITKLLDRDVLPRFRAYAAGELLKAKLP
jgi:hypothetical protein